MIEETLISPTYDFLFNYIFADPENEDILRDFLSSVLTLPEQEYERITIVDPHLLRRHKQAKQGILDVRIETTSGHSIEIEMQRKAFVGMENRIVWYNSSILAEQPVKGMKYHKMKKAISIVIADYLMYPRDDMYHHIIHPKDAVTMEMFGDIVEYNILELPKVKTDAMHSGDEREKRLLQWLRFFKATTEEEFMVLARESSILEKAFQIVMIASGSQWMKALYDQKRKEEATLYYMQNGAYTQGISEGAEKKARETARKFKAMGLSAAQIAEGTGLSADEIEEL
jgi:predicted transposase/invertase (TIGR01784 family)